MHHIHLRFLTLVFTASLLFWASIVGAPATAAPIPLGDLLVPDAFFTQGDKRFNHFSTNAPPDPDFPVFIRGTTINGQHGFALITNIDAQTGETFSSLSSFIVTVVNNPGLIIQSVTNELNFTPETGGSNALTLESSFFDQANDPGHTVSLGNLSTVWSDSPTGSRTLGQGLHQLFVEMHLTENGPVKGALTIQMTFTQAPASVSPVPVPPAALLFGSGLLGLVWLWYRSRKTA